MSQAPTQINAVVSKIKPVQLVPEQDVLLVVPSKSAVVQYYVAKLVPGSPAIPGIVGVGKTLDEKGNVVSPAVEGKPAVPAVPDSYIVVDQGTIALSDLEWDGWTTQDDEKYLVSIVSKRLGVTVL